MEEIQVKKSKDWLFIFGLIIFLFGYIVFAVPTMMSFVALPIYVLGAILLLFSRRSWRTKLLIIVPTFFINWLFIKWLFE
ncbi:hypothetical protein BH09BAC3_BH09BAC3_30150 [soil metagenome]